MKKYPAVSFLCLYPGETRAGTLGHANRNSQSSTTISISPERETAKSTYGGLDELWGSHTMARYYKTMKEKNLRKTKIKQKKT